MILSKNINKVIKILFELKETIIVSQALSHAEFPLINNNLERVQYAILFGSKGKVDTFIECLKIATTDWRDILAIENLAGENWKEVLSEKLKEIYKE